MKIAHFSDPHLGAPTDDWTALFDKRWVGLFNYKFRRSYQHDPKYLERAVSYKKTIISMHLDGSQLNSGFSFYLGNQQIVPVKTIDKNNANVQKVLNAIRFFVD